MKLATAILASLALAAAIITAGCGKKQPPASAATTQAAPDDSQNAGPLYIAIEASLEKPFTDQINAFAKGDHAVVEPSLATALRSHATAVNEIIRVSKLDRCDFGLGDVDLTTLLPHLAQIRTLARLLNADAMRCLSEGDVNGAAGRAAAAVRMGRHVGGSASSLIDARVGMATMSIGINLINEKINPSALAPEVRSELKQLLSALDASDPAGVKASLYKDRDALVSSLRKNHFPEGDMGLGRDWSKASQRERDQAADDVTAAFERIVQVWDQRDAESQMKKIDQEIPMRSQGLMPATEKIHSSTVSFAADLSEAKKRLE
jgi:hypothetical protein